MVCYIYLAAFLYDCVTNNTFIIDNIPEYSMFLSFVMI